MFEVSDSENEPRYEEAWRQLLESVNGNPTPQIYRMFDRGVVERASEEALRNWAELPKKHPKKWFQTRVVNWPVDLLVLATRAHDPIEALVGMSSADFDRWMAVHTTNESW